MEITTSSKPEMEAFCLRTDARFQEVARKLSEAAAIFGRRDIDLAVTALDDALNELLDLRDVLISFLSAGPDNDE